MPAGQTTHVLALARGLSQRGHRVTVALPQHLDRSIAALNASEVSTVPLPMGKLLWPTGSARSVARLVRREGIDIVHIHSQESGLLGRLLARMAGAATLVYTPQVLDIRQTRWYWLYVLLERALAHITDAIVSVDEPGRTRLLGWGIPPSKLFTIANGIDLARFAEPPPRCDLRRTLGLEQDGPLVMQVARLTVQKDPLAFVEGAAQVVCQRPDVQFALVGDGPLRDVVAGRIRELGLDAHVRLLGWRDEAYGLMPAADVLTLTSQWEGLPHVLLEAMAWSRPVVATAVNGCLDAVVDGETGFLVPLGEPVAWAQRVLDLLDDPAKAARMGRQGRQRVEQCFSQETMIARIETLYLQLSTPARATVARD
jgi:glycosyltransferase involved in cell wall biosynthesis